MLQNIIIIENENDYQCNTFEEVVKKLVDEKYYEYEEIERKEKLKIKAISNSYGTGYEIIDNVDKKTEISNKIVINNEFTYIMSLLIMNKIVLLENVNSNVFIKDIDRTKIDKNYIIVNKFAKELLRKSLQSRGE